MICVSISNTNIDQAVETIKKNDLAEIRLDLTKWNKDQIRNIFSSHSNLIATLRPGGINEKDRELLLKEAIEAGAKYVDIEIESSALFKQAISTTAIQCGCDIIISYHNYDETPVRSELEKIVDDCFLQGAHVAKIATFVHSVHDVARILGLYERDKRIVALGMGDLGKITRVMALKLGAEFSFASKGSDTTTAPGQLTVEEMHEFAERLKSI